MQHNQNINQPDQDRKLYISIQPSLTESIMVFTNGSLKTHKNGSGFGFNKRNYTFTVEAVTILEAYRSVASTE